MLGQFKKKSIRIHLFKKGDGTGAPSSLHYVVLPGVKNDGVLPIFSGCSAYGVDVPVPVDIVIIIDVIRRRAGKHG